MWVGGGPSSLAERFAKRYGNTFEYYFEEFHPNCVWHTETTKASELKGKIQIVMQVNSWDISILVHELNHVMWRLSRLCGLELNYDSQEWGSCLMEFLVKSCIDKKKYEKL